MGSCSAVAVFRMSFSVRRLLLRVLYLRRASNTVTTRVWVLVVVVVVGEYSRRCWRRRCASAPPARTRGAAPRAATTPLQPTNPSALPHCAPTGPAGPPTPSHLPSQLPRDSPRLTLARICSHYPWSRELNNMVPNRFHVTRTACNST